MLKNSIRIFDNYKIKYYDYPWPQIYSLDKNKSNKPQYFNPIKNNDEIIYYHSNGELCMYSKSPCSNYKLTNLKKSKFATYTIFYFE